MIDGLLKISEILLGRRDKLREADADRRTRVSLYFENVSRCLSDMAVALKAGTEPWQACEELRTYNYEHNGWGADLNREGVIVEVFGQDSAKEVGRQLHNLTGIRGGALLVLSVGRRGDSDAWYYGKPPSQELLSESIIKIEQAAGQFKALSVLASTISGK